MRRPDLYASMLLFMLTGAVRAADLSAPSLSLAPVLLADASPGADPKTDSPPPALPAPFYGVTGNWFGVRDQLNNHNITAGGMIQLDVTKVLRGGLDTEATATRYLLNLHVLFGGDAWGRPQDCGYFELLAHDQSENGDATVGDINGFDNIDSVRFVQINQLWYKLELPFGTFKFGKMDANADVHCNPDKGFMGFSLIEHSTDFLQSAAVYSPTMFPMVTYPDPAPGVAFFGGDRGIYAGLGAFYSNSKQTFLDLAGHPETIERTPGGVFLITELGLRRNFIPDLETHLGIGAWFHTGRFPRIDDPDRTPRGAYGGYVFADHTLYQEKSGEDVTRDLGIFFHAGLADPATSPMSQNLTCGVAARGFTPSRPNDTMGLVGTWSHLPAQAGQLHNFELATEAYYKIQITPWASLKPSFAYIINPSGQLPDAAVATVRAEIDF